MSHLFEDLEAIFDTPSKRTIWMYIMPLLSMKHKDEIRDRIHAPNVALLPPSQRRLKETLVRTTNNLSMVDMIFLCLKSNSSRIS